MAEIRSVLWLFFVLGFTFGICDRSFAAIQDGVLDAIDLVQLFTASFFAVCSAFLKPSN